MDLQVTYLRDVLRVDQVTNVPNVFPRTIDVRGPDFRSVERVEINEVIAPSFVVMSRQRLLVQVPDSQETQLIRTIAVLSSRFTKTEQSQVKFEFTSNPKRISGIQKLMQAFLLMLLRSPGTCAWMPKTGGGLQRLIGAHFDRSNVGGVTAAFSTAVSRTRSQLIALQATNTRLTSDEKLAAANILSAVFNANQTALLARVELISQSGERAIVGLEL
jgi:hypothetical protein